MGTKGSVPYPSSLLPPLLCCMDSPCCSRKATGQPTINTSLSWDTWDLLRCWRAAQLLFYYSWQKVTTSLKRGQKPRSTAILNCATLWNKRTTMRSPNVCHTGTYTHFTQSQFLFQISGWAIIGSDRTVWSFDILPWEFYIPRAAHFGGGHERAQEEEYLSSAGFHEWRHSRRAAFPDLRTSGLCSLAEKSLFPSDISLR